jgi:hypothetical protein
MTKHHDARSGQLIDHGYIDACRSSQTCGMRAMLELDAVLPAMRARCEEPSMKTNESTATVIASPDVVTEYRWSFPHHLTLVVSVCEKGETMLAIVQGDGLPPDKRGRTPSLSGVHGEAVPHITATIQDHTPPADLSGRHVCEGLRSETCDASWVLAFGTRLRSAVSAVCRELWKPFRCSDI